MTGNEKSILEELGIGPVKIPTKLMYDNAKLPVRKFPSDAGADGFVCRFSKIGTNRNLIPYHEKWVILKPLDRIACHLGIRTKIPDGFFFDVRPRSGLALFEGLTILNSPGTIDAGYRGEWIANLVNVSQSQVKLEIGDRVCQLIMQKIYQFEFVETTKLSKSKRGSGGFGSTGKQ